MLLDAFCFEFLQSDGLPDSVMDMFDRGLLNAEKQTWIALQYVGQLPIVVCENACAKACHACSHQMDENCASE